MPRNKAKPVNIDPHEVTINVYPFVGDRAIVAWIELGYLTTIAGCPGNGVRVEIGPQTRLDPDGKKLRTAAGIVARRGYKDAWAKHSDGTLTRIEAV